MYKFLYIIVLIFSLLSVPVIVYAEENVQRFKTLADRRDAGISHEITPWLILSPSIELESEVISLDPAETSSYTLRERSKSLQFDIELIAADGLKAEIEYEYDDQLDEFVLEEAVAELELDDFKLELGKLYVPFGEYYSRFVNGPLLEFGETRARSVVISYEPDEQLEAAIFIFKSKRNDTLADEDNYDWGLSINIVEEDSFTLGLSYLSDLSEAEESLLEESGFYLQRVGALSAYSNIEFEDYEVSFEFVQTLSHFTELDTQANQPFAWNIELGIYPEGNVDWAFRFEGSQELEDAPRYQAGINTTWHASKYLSASLEYLHGRFKKAFVEDELEQELSSQNRLAAQLIISF